MHLTIFYNRNYIPFDLYIQSLNYIFSKNNYDFSIINNIDTLDYKTKFLILFVNDLEIIYYSKKIIENNIKVILIVADYLINCSLEFQHLFINYAKFLNSNNIFIWEYNKLNIDYFTTIDLKLNSHFIPLLYNEYLEEIYKKNMPEKINFEDKPIDVLFMGGIGGRRDILLNKISKKFKLHIMMYVNDISEYIKTIEKSKLVIHIYAKENNKSFDYYRSALLYCNKILFLNETIRDYDFDIEPNLIELSNNIIMCQYENIIENIDEILNKKTEHNNNVVNNIYLEYKKYNMETSIINFFTNFEKS